MANTRRFVLIHDQPNCIGCGACASINPKHWKMNDETNKSFIIDGEFLPDGGSQRDIDDEQFKLNKEAAEVCPVKVIHIKEKSSNKQII
ncbi:ferredoxin [Candidatus Woesearchaeota archaeon]|nr:ferredoxin [Candidatus Woesearchaeota archaeon]